MWDKYDYDDLDLELDDDLDSDLDLDLYDDLYDNEEDDAMLAAFLFLMMRRKRGKNGK